MVYGFRGLYKFGRRELRLRIYISIPAVQVQRVWRFGCEAPGSYTCNMKVEKNLYPKLKPPRPIDPRGPLHPKLNLKPYTPKLLWKSSFFVCRRPSA